ncbi:Cobalt/magnesium transport protein CorA [Lachnellula suecica]|uniref:Cobalt/magnesium transport protein CorA n=1 Tax=Lachnellula suecica TaxID=602035 RepID=A0A8T9CFW9_9HELO|nr:Cobalt/magnesium transport protein CorA [Lachnellula suecica]
MFRIIGRYCRVQQPSQIAPYRNALQLTSGESRSPCNAPDFLKHWSSTLSGTTRLLNSENAYTSRTNWKPGQEPGLDPGSFNDAEHQDIPRANSEITVVDFSEDRITTQHLDNASLLKWVGQQNSKSTWAKCRWINVNGLSWDVIQALGKYKNLHRLAIEDLVHAENRTKADWYSDHVFISLTLQKLVRPLEESPDSPNELKNVSHVYEPRRGRVGTLLDHLFKRENTGPSDNGFVLARQKTSNHSCTKKLRTLQGYRGGSDANRIAFMEARSALTRMNLVVCAEQVSIFLLSDNTVISFFESSAADVETPILARLNTKDTILRSSCDASMLTQAIIDTIIDLAVPVATAYKDVSGALEMEVLTDPNIQHAKDLYVITSEITAIRNFITPIASLVASLYGQRPDSPIKPTLHEQRSSSQIKISPATKTYLGDMEDHCFLILQTFDQLHHSARGMIDLIFHTISANQNESMKQLTAATILFLPLTFITGYFGMNLTEFPTLENNELFFWKIAGPIATVFGITMLLYNIKTYLLTSLAHFTSQLPSNDTLQSSNPAIPQATTFEAELHCGALPAEIVPASFDVYLSQGHSLEQHFAAISIDLTPYIVSRLDWVFHTVGYAVDGIGDDMLKAIRADEGVRLVECNYWMHAAAEL